MSASRSSPIVIHRRKAALVLMAACAAVMTVASTALANGAGAPGRPIETGELHIYYRSPVLVRPGERVRIPVDVSCATIRGLPCRASAAVGTAGPSGRWREMATSARPGLSFDLTAPATRASVPGGPGALSYTLSARGAGRTLSLPPAGRGSLRMYVARAMPRIEVPPIRLGKARRGTLALYLPWGTGPLRAGLSPGNESATVGPPSFDVDRRGHIHVLDALQHRVAVFGARGLIRQFRISATPQSDLAVSRDGMTYVASQRAGRVRAQVVTPSGRPRRPWSLGDGILGEVRTSVDSAFVHLLPLDAWIPLGSGRGHVEAGLRQPSGALLVRSVVGNAIRVGLARGSGVRRAMELDPHMDLGELDLTARDGKGGFLTVFRVMGEGSATGYQVADVASDGAVTTFAIRDRSFADPMALSRFRLGRDGDLYQLATFPDGMRILRYEMGEGS